MLVAREVCLALHSRRHLVQAHHLGRTCVVRNRVRLMVLCYYLVSNYIIYSYQKYAASALAAKVFIRTVVHHADVRPARVAMGQLAARLHLARHGDYSVFVLPIRWNFSRNSHSKKKALTTPKRNALINPPGMGRDP